MVSGQSTGEGRNAMLRTGAGSGQVQPQHQDAAPGNWQPGLDLLRLRGEGLSKGASTKRSTVNKVHL